MKQPETRRYVNNEEYYAIRDMAYGHYAKHPEMDTGIAYQMWYDLRIYKLYDAVAMWTDHVAGLAHWEPDLILRVGEYFFDSGNEPEADSGS